MRRPLALKWTRGEAVAGCERSEIPLSRLTLRQPGGLERVTEAVLDWLDPHVFKGLP